MCRIYLKCHLEIILKRSECMSFLTIHLHCKRVTFQPREKDSGTGWDSKPYGWHCDWLSSWDLLGDSQVKSFRNLGHYDFAKSECVGNKKFRQQGLGPTDQDFDTIVLESFEAVHLSRWLVASEKALSFSDNEKLTPGRNDSKVYPGDIRVLCTAIPMPNTSPQVCTSLISCCFEEVVNGLR